MEQLTYNDIQSDLASTIEQYGARKFLHDFFNNYPRHFEEFAAQINRPAVKAQVPRLLDKTQSTTSPNATGKVEGGSDAPSM